MKLVQFFDSSNTPLVAMVNGDDQLQVLNSASSLYELVLESLNQGTSLEGQVQSRLSNRLEDYNLALQEQRVRLPLEHPDPAHCLVTGTGLTHLGSAEARNKMHSEEDTDDTPPTDSMKLFRLGVEGGKPETGDSVQPEWFFKGQGHCLVAPEHPISSPAFADDGGEEAELVGLYVVAPTGDILRVGFALGNEFSDHVMERKNYLYLAHSKIRHCSFGPEVFIGELPSDIQGTVSIRRNEELIWSEPFVTGEDNMSYWIRNLEQHHFKYPIFRQPGDVHCHYFGTATLSFSAGIRAEEGDVFEVAAPPFSKPLRNPLRQSAADSFDIRNV